MKLSYALMFLALFPSCQTVSSPPRPDNVVPEAVWAGGSDGGAWIHCLQKTYEPYVGYDCQIFNDQTGAVWAEGRFILAEVSGDNVDFPADPLAGGKINRFKFYNGRVIAISSRRFLYPNGWIDYPFGDGHGKRARYALGEEQEIESY